MFSKKLAVLNYSLIILVLSFLLLTILNIDLPYFDYEIVNKFKNSFFFKILFFSLLFIIISLCISFFKFSKIAIKKAEEKRVSILIEENEELKSFAKIDLLTKKFNKEYFSLRFEQEFKRSIREKLSISLIIININEFKAYNELYGNEQGDTCLKKIAEVLSKQCIRPSDIIARIEADTFYLLLPNTKHSLIVAKKCKKAVDDLALDHDNSILASIVRIRYGTATIKAKDINEMNTLLQNAKESLNKKKKIRVIN